MDGYFSSFVCQFPPCHRTRKQSLEHSLANDAHNEHLFPFDQLNAAVEPNERKSEGEIKKTAEE